MKLDPKVFNKIISNLNYPDSTVLKFIEQKEISTPINSNYGDGLQGEKNTFYKIYQIIEYPEYYLKVTYFTDSYGDNEYIKGAELVQPVEKLIKVFE